jgi:hypothetical protein
MLQQSFNLVLFVVAIRPFITSEEHHTNSDHPFPYYFNRLQNNKSSMHILV